MVHRQKQCLHLHLTGCYRLTNTLPELKLVVTFLNILSACWIA